MDTSRIGRDTAAAEESRARGGLYEEQAKAIRSPGALEDKWVSAGDGQIYNQRTGEFRASERPEDPNALSERDKLEIQHTNRLKEIEARKATTGGGPDPKVLMEVERDRSDRLMRAESAKLKAVAGDDDITPEEMAAVESMYKQQVKIIEEMYEREKQAALGGGAPAIPPNPYRQQAPMPAAPGPPSPTPMRGGMPMGTPNLF
jgi:hypothetical protein